MPIGRVLSTDTLNGTNCFQQPLNPFLRDKIRIVCDIYPCARVTGYCEIGRPSIVRRWAND